MAAQVLTNAQVLVGAFDAQSFIGTVETTPAAVRMVNTTNMGSGGYACSLPSIKN